MDSDDFKDIDIDTQQPEVTPASSAAVLHPPDTSTNRNGSPPKKTADQAEAGKGEEAKVDVGNLQRRVGELESEIKVAYRSVESINSMQISTQCDFFLHTTIDQGFTTKTHNPTSRQRRNPLQKERPNRYNACQTQSLRVRDKRSNPLPL